MTGKVIRDLEGRSHLTWHVVPGAMGQSISSQCMTIGVMNGDHLRSRAMRGRRARMTIERLFLTHVITIS
jgi:hypothetical protein